MSRIPLQSECDPTKPEEALLWASMFIPVSGRSPMVWPRMMAEKFSTHYTQCGFVHVDYIRSLADENGMVHIDQLPTQKKKFIRPYRGQQHPLNNQGGWVKMDTEVPDPVVIQDPAAMTPHELNAQVERMRYMGFRINEPEDGPKKASVGKSKPDFDPSTHSATEVNAYLRDLDRDDPEYRAVVRSEESGKARQGILKRHKGRNQ